MSESRVKYALVACNKKNVELMKILVEKCFPIHYSEEFYDKVAFLYNEFTRFLTVKDIVVGGISCRVETNEETGEQFLHIMILLVLDKYRRLGLAAAMMKEIESIAKKSDHNLQYISLHVQKINEAAVNFYLSQGFENAGEFPNYYTDIENPDAIFMRKSLK